MSRKNHSDCSLLWYTGPSPYTTPSLSEIKRVAVLYTVILKGAMAEDKKDPSYPGADSTARDNDDQDKKQAGNKPKEFLVRRS